MKYNKKTDRSKNDKSRLTLIVFIVLPLFMCVTSFAMYRKVSLLKNEMDGVQESGMTKDRFSLLSRSIYDAWSNDGYKINPEFLNITNTNSLDSYSDFFAENKQLLICRISENNCESCVDYMLNEINALSSDTTFNMGIVVMGEYTNMALKILCQQQSLSSDIKTYSVIGPLLPIEEQGFPYFFVMDRDYRVSNVFSPDKKTQQLTDAYFKLLKKKYQ